MDNQYNDDLSAMLRYGVSEELIGLFDAVATTTCAKFGGGVADGELKFPRQAVSLLRRAVLCRTYGKALWELAHLVAAVAVRDGKSMDATQAVLAFFWQDGQASPAVLRHGFGEPCEHLGVSVAINESLHIEYPDGEYRISPSRYPFLAALIEFVTFIDPGIITGLSTTLSTVNAKSVDALAKLMQSRVAAFLADNMQLEHHQRKFRSIIGWLAANECRGADVSDQTVLDFWLHAMDTGLDDFKRFNVVARDFFSLLALLSEGRASRHGDYAFSLGPDWDAGEIDPERLEDLVADLEAESEIFSELEKPPLDGIKFCMDPDRRVFEPIDEAGPWRSDLPLSLARMETLGAVQNRISQHLRNRSASPLQPLLSCDDAKTYGDYSRELARRREKLELTRDATLHVLHQLQHPEAAVAAAERLSAETRCAIRESLGLTEDNDVEAAPIESLSALALRHPELNAILTGWSRAFKKVNRAGFSEIPEKHQGDNYGAGLRLIELLLRRIDDFLAALDKAAATSTNGVARFVNDREIFSTVYFRMYGAEHD